MYNICEAINSPGQNVGHFANTYNSVSKVVHITLQAAVFELKVNIQKSALNDLQMTFEIKSLMFCFDGADASKMQGKFL